MRSRAGILLVLAGLVGLVGNAHAQGSPEGLILTVARAQDLADAALEDAVTPIGALLIQIGPSSSYLAGRQGFGHFSLSVGALGAGFDMTNPDYTAADPEGADQISGGVGAFYGDLSLGLYSGYDLGRVHSVGSADLLLRLGFTLGDQENIDESLDLGSLRPIYGAGLRLGILKGEGLPSISLSSGMNFFQERTFGVSGQVDGTPFEVNLNFEQSSAFFLLEIGKDFGAISPYVVGGVARHRLEARYDSVVVYDANASTVEVGDQVDFRKTRGIAYGGFEFGGGTIRVALEGGISGSEPFGTFHLRFFR